MISSPLKNDLIVFDTEEFTQFLWDSACVHEKKAVYSHVYRLRKMDPLLVAKDPCNVLLFWSLFQSACNILQWKHSTLCSSTQQRLHKLIICERRLKGEGNGGRGGKRLLIKTAIMQNNCFKKHCSIVGYYQIELSSFLQSFKSFLYLLETRRTANTTNMLYW